jgi:hypothetical protein
MFVLCFFIIKKNSFLACHIAACLIKGVRKYRGNFSGGDVVYLKSVSSLHQLLQDLAITDFL